MQTEDDVYNLEKLIVQLECLHNELSQLTKKSPNDGLNLFKLKLVNKVLESGNQVLRENYKPFEDFNEFEEEELPTNSDVTMILALYIEQAERFRSDNIAWSNHDHLWRYVLNGKNSEFNARPPSRIGVFKK